MVLIRLQKHNSLRGIIAVIACACYMTSSIAAPIKLACIGDSITMGIGSTDYWRKSYPGVLMTLLGTGYDVQNYGISSMNVRGYSSTAIFTQAVGTLPDIVIFCLGTNDANTWCWQWHSTFVADYQALVDSFKNLSSHPALYICLPPWIAKDDAQSGYTDARLQSLFPLIEQVAQSTNATIIDLHSVTINHPEYYAAEGANGSGPFGIHPNDSGYKAMAEKIYCTIKQECVPTSARAPAALGSASTMSMNTFLSVTGDRPVLASNMVHPGQTVRMFDMKGKYVSQSTVESDYSITVDRSKIGNQALVVKVR
jgi:acyl-CoA thioesterase I